MLVKFAVENVNSINNRLYILQNGHISLFINSLSLSVFNTMFKRRCLFSVMESI